MVLFFFFFQTEGTANSIMPCDEQESSSEEDEITDKVFTSS